VNPASGVSLMRVGQGLFLAALALFILGPLIVVAGVSLNGSARMTFPPEDVGLRWYRTFFSDPSWTLAFERSLIIAAASSVLATSIAFAIAYALWKRGGLLPKALAALGAAPFLIPPVIIAVLFLLFWGVVKHVGQIENVIISHAIAFLAAPLVLITLGFGSVRRELVEAATTMGAREQDVLRTIVWPMVLPFVVSGLVFAAILSLNEYLIAFMVAGFTVETLPVKVFTAMRTGFTPTMCVGAVLFAVVGLAGFLALAWLGDLPKLLGGRAR
jgi:putative spermidine/putrescine transport system permease protein